MLRGVIVTVTCTLFSVACGGEPQSSAGAERTATAEQALSDAGTEVCSQITQNSFSALESAIADAANAADQDYTGLSGVDHNDSAFRSRQFAQSAATRVTNLKTWMGSLSASNASVAYSVSTYMADVIRDLLTSSHNALISAVWNGTSGNPARTTHEKGRIAIEIANEIGVQAGRCYLTAYNR
jgi:hypothetical protein